MIDRLAKVEQHTVLGKPALERPTVLSGNGDLTLELAINGDKGCDLVTVDHEVDRVTRRLRLGLGLGSGLLPRLNLHDSKGMRGEFELRSSGSRLEL